MQFFQRNKSSKELLVFYVSTVRSDRLQENDYNIAWRRLFIAYEGIRSSASKTLPTIQYLPHD